MTDPTRRAAEITALALRAGRGRPAPTGGAPPPPGCWCGGAGGRDPRYLPDPLGVEQASPGHPDLLRVFGVYCSCDAGQRLKALEDDLRAAVFAAQDELRADRLWGAAGVPPHYHGLTLDSYPVTPETAPAVARVREWLATGDRWLLLWGAYGTGKTGLAVAALRERLRGAAPGEAGAQARFITVPDLLARLRHSYDRGDAGRETGRLGGMGPTRGATEGELLDDLHGADLLVLDDLGAERATDWAVERLFGVLNRRHDWRRPTILTTNLSPAQLARHAGERIAWRIVELCRGGDEAGARFVVEVRGPNLRDRGAAPDETRPRNPDRVLPGARPSHPHAAPHGGPREATDDSSAVEEGAR